MKLSVDDHHPFKLGDVLLDATGEASFVEEDDEEPRVQHVGVPGTDPCP